MPWDAAFESAYASSLISLLAVHLVNLAITEIGHIKNVGKNLRSLADKQIDIQKKLDQLGDHNLSEHFSRPCVEDLTKLFYQVDDFIDAIKLDVMRSNHNEARFDTPECSSTITSFISARFRWVSGSAPPAPPTEIQAMSNAILSSLKNWGLPRKIKSLLNKLDKVEKQVERIIQPTTSANNTNTPAPAVACLPSGISVSIARFSLTAEKRLPPGREIAMEPIIDHLIRFQGRGVSIVGMSGLGKTMLARSILRHKRICIHFSRFIWASVPGGAFTENANIEFEEARDYNGIIRGRPKTLLVIDGLCQVHHRPWRDFISSDYITSYGEITVLITTHNINVASDTNTTLHQLELLSDQDCQELIMHNLPKHIHRDCYGRYHHRIARIAKKCAGLPLVADVLGLEMGAQCRKSLEMAAKCGKSSDNSETIISHFEVTDIWKMKVFQEQIFPHLRLQEIFKSLELNRFLAYLSLFPLCHKFERYELSQLWMAEGFVQPEEWNMDGLNNAFQYFEKLLSISVLHLTGHKDGTLYQIHEFTHRLVKSVARNKCCLIKGGQSTNLPPNHIRHLSIHSQELEPSYLEDTIGKSYKLLRTFLLLHDKGTNISQLPKSLFEALQLLRVLKLGNSGITSLPRSISNLKHLRYLDASNTLLEALPDTICELLGLRVIKLKPCIKLRQLPQEIGNLVNLIILEVYMARLTQLPRNIGKLTKLQSLDTFTVRKTEGHRISELCNLNDLHGSIRILELENVNSMSDAQNARLGEKPLLKTMEMQWTETEITSMRERNATCEILKQLQPHRNLSELKLTSYRGDLFPKWLSDPSSCHLTIIHLYNCPVSGVDDAQFWKLRSLKTLFVDEVPTWEQVRRRFFGESGKRHRFAKLECLKLQNMERLTGWEGMEPGNDTMPRLHRLELVRCPSLSALPVLAHLPALSANIIIVKCPNLVVCPQDLPPGVTWESS